MKNTSVQAHGARLSQLDGLRGIAALAIMLFHLAAVFHTSGPFVRGYLFVDLFFLLSGFVLAVSTERKLASGIGALEFAASRFVRLWPLVAVGVGVAVVRALVIGLYDPLTFVLAVALDLAMIPNFSGVGPFYRFNGPQWTLFYELVANFLHALWLRKVPTRWLPLVVAVFGALLVWTVRSRGADSAGPNSHAWTAALVRTGWSYSMGVWLGRLYREGLRTPVLPWFLTLALPVAGLVALPHVTLPRAEGDLWFVMAFLPLSVWLVAQSRVPRAVAPVLEWFGNYSLPLYCVHLTVLVWVSELMGLGQTARVVAVATALVLSWVFSRLVSFASKPTLAKPA
ncbi:MAG: acyltransferase [Novosphingobium sp.]|uniref:acyltransferase family protein n=1 Tax=Novosphingobium sp. TaxID=1874826 RepID=UPI00263602A9|nr:acyltransferase [Novosphingobium sp.]MCP5386927.1 acyltransferase [Novosphingobium sp.]